LSLPQPSDGFAEKQNHEYANVAWLSPGHVGGFIASSSVPPPSSPEEVSCNSTSDGAWAVEGGNPTLAKIFIVDP
jgi:hypothetical protein